MSKKVFSFLAADVQIIFGEYDISNGLALKDSDDMPATSSVQWKAEMAASGQMLHKKIIVDPEDIVLKFDRTYENDNFLSQLNSAFESGYEASLSIIDKESGEVHWEYQKVRIKDNKFLTTSLTKDNTADGTLTFVGGSDVS